jgi:hypothetical protein
LVDSCSPSPALTAMDRNNIRPLMMLRRQTKHEDEDRGEAKKKVEKNPMSWEIFGGDPLEPESWLNQERGRGSCLSDGDVLLVDAPGWWRDMCTKHTERGGRSVPGASGIKQIEMEKKRGDASFGSSGQSTTR